MGMVRIPSERVTDVIVLHFKNALSGIDLVIVTIVSDVGMLKS